jgi:uncharacterized SAM-binding protein YcdF (DUF218 family)
MLSHLFKRQTIWGPTLPGWLFLLVLFVTPVGLWSWFGEDFLSRTDRQPADVLVVEAWINTEGVRAATAEFKRGGYRHIVVTGSLTGHPWTDHRFSLVEIARKELLRQQVPEDKIVSAPVPETDYQRTYMAAVAARHALEARGLRPTHINVFTLGAHARRSRLVFAKVFGSDIHVGVVSWTPTDHKATAWWRSSVRAVEFLKESVGWILELLFNSGRLATGPAHGSRR